ncbi:MAG: hypothetical protein ASARMPREDX12_000534 [Alectoria sarmentosa]|nr:MAG: hypothetical protein ASARMPREDX12_000534 [Alectoria sarmentosa]
MPERLVELQKQSATASTMTVSLDEQHAAYDRQPQENTAIIGLDVHHAAHHQQHFSSPEFVDVVPQRGPGAYTEVCEIISPSLHNPPLQPGGGNKPLETSQYHCSRCDTTFSRSHSVKQHFRRCIKINGNPDALRWFDHESNNLTGTRKQNNLKTIVTPSTRKRSGFSIASLLSDEPEVIMAEDKVGRWAAMAAEKQAATVASTSENLKGIGPSASHNLAGVTASGVDVSSHKTTPIANKPASMPTATPEKGSPHATPATPHEPVILARKQKQPTSTKPKKSRQIGHDETTAHLFNNAGVLMPSIPGIDSVTERLFDKGEIMSLGRSRSQDSYYPGGEPQGGSFLLNDSSQKKRKRDDDNGIGHQRETSGLITVMVLLTIQEPSIIKTGTPKEDLQATRKAKPSTMATDTSADAHSAEQIVHKLQELIEQLTLIENLDRINRPDTIVRASFTPTVPAPASFGPNESEG